LKTIRLGNEISLLSNFEDEPFWKYMDRFKELLTQFSHHGLELCQIIYEGLDVLIRTLIEFMCEEEFFVRRLVQLGIVLRI